MNANEKQPHVALLIESSLASGRDILRGIAQYVRERQPWSLYYEPRSLEESLPRWLRRWKGDGIIARIQNRRIAQEVADVGVPVVDVLGLVPRATFPLVHVNDEQISKLAATHLMERGFRHFGFFGITGENWSTRRRNAFSDHVQQLKFTCHVYELPRRPGADQSWEILEDKLAQWISQLPKPIGIMVCSDQRGPQFLEACRRAQVSVPDEVAIIGVDNDEALCEVCNPPMSSIQAGHALVGFEAASLLHRLMQGQDSPSSPLLITPQGVATRASTDVLAIDDRPVAAALKAIREKACTSISVDEVARIAGLSRSVLQRRFRALLKRSVHEEIVLTRLKRAKTLLIETDLPLPDIAEKTGFKHQEYLGAVFKKFDRQTPAKFRRQNSLEKS